MFGVAGCQRIANGDVEKGWLTFGLFIVMPETVCSLRTELLSIRKGPCTDGIPIFLMDTTDHFTPNCAHVCGITIQARMLHIALLLLGHPN